MNLNLIKKIVNKIMKIQKSSPDKFESNMTMKSIQIKNKSKD